MTYGIIRSDDRQMREQRILPNIHRCVWVLPWWCEDRRPGERTISFSRWLAFLVV